MNKKDRIAVVLSVPVLMLVVMRQCRCPEVRSYLSREVLSNIEEFF
jgi:hypothetical protein